MEKYFARRDNTASVKRMLVEQQANKKQRASQDAKHVLWTI